MPISWEPGVSTRSGVVACQKTTYHLDPLLPRSSSLEVLGRRLDVVVDHLLGQINHVGREKRLVVLLEVLLVGVHHAVEPRKQLLRAVVGVEHDWDAVGWGHRADVVSGRDGAGDRSLLILVLDALDARASALPSREHPKLLHAKKCTDLSAEVGRPTLRHLQDDRGFGIASCLECCYDGRRRSNVLGPRLACHSKVFARKCVPGSNSQWQGWRRYAPERS